MAVTHTTVGFKGTVGQSEEAQRLARLGPRFTVGSATDWLLSASSGDRTVTIAPGSGQACGVQDRTVAADTLQLPANNATSERFDLIVARFLWTDPVTPVAFAFVQGTAGAGAPPVAGLVRTPGSQYDGVLGVVRVAPGQGTLTANDVFNLGLTGTSGALNGGPAAARYLNALDTADGDQLWLPPTTVLPERLIGRSRGTWRQQSPPIIGTFFGQFVNLPDAGDGTGNEVWGSDPQQLGWVDVPDVGVPWKTGMKFRAEAGSSQATTRWDFALQLDAINGPVLDYATGDRWVSGQNWRPVDFVMPPNERVLTGAHRIYVVARAGDKPSAGPALGVITPYNRLISATVYAA
jgi:hypothetical protein